jgi:hypothetical protein
MQEIASDFPNAKGLGLRQSPLRPGTASNTIQELENLVADLKTLIPTLQTIRSSCKMASTADCGEG